MAMREIQRTVVGALLLSEDEKILLGRRPENSSGVYPGTWQLPGGGVERDESLETALCREIQEETGLDVSALPRKLIDDQGIGATEKTLSSGERVHVHMAFYIFQVELLQCSRQIDLAAGIEFSELRWFVPSELAALELVPAGRELFARLGMIASEKKKN